ncbi:MAG: sulfatase [Planctomycetia bacterium]|nr:sulfatase [Planctomycetia bacterium]
MVAVFRLRVSCLLAGVLVGLLAAAAPVQADDATAKRQSVLFIAIDDLNHWVGHLGRNPQIRTPSIDRLAAMGVTFTHAYCAAPVCNPSRTALLSGMRPGTTGVYNNNIDFRPHVAPELTLNSHLRRHGYFTAGAGKIYHGGAGRREEWDDYFARRGGAPRNAAAAGDLVNVGGITWKALENADDTAVIDYHTVSYCIEQLEKKHDRPFFLACGITKPHMPWSVPKKYFDIYPLESIQLPPFKEDDLDDLPQAGVRMARPQGDHAAITKAGAWKQAIQAYMAATTFTDGQVGRLLEALKRCPHKDNTIVVFWGDHGWHLGEKHHWRKFTLWEEATRAPLIWVAPGVTKAGGTCDRTVDFMSIYPTLCDLAGLSIPQHVEGQSIRSLLADPQAKWDKPAVTTHGYQNHAVRSERWRYIRYADGGEELYDHSQDPYEWTNLAGSAELESVKKDLARWLPKENKPAPSADRETNR